jgi:conjugative transfer region protein (TIGR03750 family)
MWVALIVGAGLVCLGAPLAVATASIATLPTCMFICMALVLLGGGKLLRRAKRARPETWLYRRLQWHLAVHWGIGTHQLILHSGPGQCAAARVDMRGRRHEPLPQQGGCAAGAYLQPASGCGDLALLCRLWYGWQAAPSDLTIHVPPDLRSGSTRKWWDVPPENIYAFALYIFGQLNRWPTDGEVDYHRAIFALQPYLTPACKTFFDGDFEYRKAAGELRGGCAASTRCWAAATAMIPTCG